jgi:hypothetical protein
MGVGQEILKTFDHQMWRNKQWDVYLILYVSLTEKVKVQRYFREQSLLELKKSGREYRQTQEDGKNTLYADADYQSIFVIWDFKNKTEASNDLKFPNCGDYSCMMNRIR